MTGAATIAAVGWLVGLAMSLVTGVEHATHTDIALELVKVAGIAVGAIGSIAAARSGRRLTRITTAPRRISARSDEDGGVVVEPPEPHGDDRGKRE